MSTKIEKNFNYLKETAAPKGTFFDAPFSLTIC